MVRDVAAVAGAEGELGMIALIKAMRLAKGPGSQNRSANCPTTAS